VAEPELSDALRRRWRVICIAAAKQSGGEFLPEIAPPAPLAEFLAVQKADIRMVGAPAAERNIPSLLQQWTPGKSIAILIGPEGGLAENEAAQVQQGGFVPVRLGEFVLRVETAAVAILAATRMYCQLFQPAR
jgi:16S rRNA (uracil1498-N3)-methyltransferase